MYFRTRKCTIVIYLFITIHGIKNKIQKKSKKPLEVREDVYKDDTVMFCITA